MNLLNHVLSSLQTLNSSIPRHVACTIFLLLLPLPSTMFVFDGATKRIMTMVRRYRSNETTIILKSALFLLLCASTNARSASKFLQTHQLQSISLLPPRHTVTSQLVALSNSYGIQLELLSIFAQLTNLWPAG